MADAYLVGLQETVALNAKNVLSIGGSSDKQAQRAAAAMQTALTTLYGQEYILVDAPATLVGICLFVLVQAVGAGEQTDARGRCVRLAKLGNKGAVALRFQLDSASVCALAVHLPAGESAAAISRDEAFAEVLESLGTKMTRRGVKRPARA